MQKTHFISIIFISLISITRINAQAVLLPLDLEHWDTVGLKVFTTEMYKGKESRVLCPGIK